LPTKRGRTGAICRVNCSARRHRAPLTFFNERRTSHVNPAPLRQRPSVGPIRNRTGRLSPSRPRRFIVMRRDGLGARPPPQFARKPRRYYQPAHGYAPSDRFTVSQAFIIFTQSTIVRAAVHEEYRTISGSQLMYLGQSTWRLAETPPATLFVQAEPPLFTPGAPLGRSLRLGPEHRSPPEASSEFISQAADPVRATSHLPPRACCRFNLKDVMHHPNWRASRSVCTQGGRPLREDIACDEGT